MTVPCVTVDVVLPAAITATDINVSQISCQQPCDVNVNVTWTNNGESQGTFEPAIIVDGVRTGLGTQIPLNPGQTIVHTFVVSNLEKGTHMICPDPN